MKIAVIILWSEPWGGGGKTGGLVTAGVNLAAELNARAIYIPPSARRKPRAAHHPMYLFQTIEQVLDERYDFVIFTSAGHFQDHAAPTNVSAMEHVISRLSDFPPFAVGIHDEVEQRQLIYRHKFFSSPKFRFAMPITREIGERMLAPEDRRIVYPHYLKHISGRNTTDARTIGMTGRMASRKNTIPFLREAARLLIADGWRVEIHGAEPNFFYARGVKEECANIGAFYYGPYEHASVVLDRLRWHVNIPYLKNGSFIPRLEIATIEAAAAGCGLITLAETTPPEVPTRKLRWGSLDEAARVVLDDANDNNTEFVNWFNEKHAPLPDALREMIRDSV